MKFQRMTDPKAERRMKREIDALAHKEQRKKIRGRVKTLKSEGLKFGACCLLGAAFGVLAYFAI